VIHVAEMDISRIGGDAVRTLALAGSIARSGITVTLVIPEPEEHDPIVPTDGVTIVPVPVPGAGSSGLRSVRRRMNLIRRTKELCSDDAMLLCETSLLGGYLALAGMRGYVLDVHGFVYDETETWDLPWYVPRGPFKTFVKNLERIALQRSSKVITVSKTMSNALSERFGVGTEKMAIIPNGYFESKVREIESSRPAEQKGMVSFVGLIARWANVDKIVRVAEILRDYPATFYIVGDGRHRGEIESMVESRGLKNILFTGPVPITRAYEIIAQSEVVLLPFPRMLSTEVACPIKVLEYMALGKAMVLDGVSDIAQRLKDCGAAVVCDPDREEEYAEGIVTLLENEELRRSIGARAKALSAEYSWERQGRLLAELLIRERMSSPGMCER
jgi:glycosyltransferase involved in cell wall biosynthesis